MPAVELDDEIISLEESVHALETRRSLLSSTLLSSPNTKKRLDSAQRNSAANSDSDLRAAIELVESQAKRNEESVYRLGAGATAFRVADPDPHAVDDGNVLGVRIEIFEDDSFTQPYYVFLHRSYPPLSALRVHKHTLPPSVPMQDLSLRYLPTPEKPDTDDSTTSEAQQDLPAFIRALRHTVDSIHRRRRTALKLVADADACFEGLNASSDLALGVTVHFSLLDPDASVLGASIEYRPADDSDSPRVELGRIEVGLDGSIKKVVFRNQGDQTRSSGTESAVRGGDGRLDNCFHRVIDHVCNLEGDAVTLAFVEQVLSGRNRLTVAHSLGVELP